MKLRGYKWSKILFIPCRVRILLFALCFSPRDNFYTVIIAIREARAASPSNDGGRGERKSRLLKENESQRRLTIKNKARLFRIITTCPHRAKLFSTSVENHFRLSLQRFEHRRPFLLLNPAILYVSIQIWRNTIDAREKIKYRTVLLSENISYHVFVLTHPF